MGPKKAAAKPKPGDESPGARAGGAGAGEESEEASELALKVQLEAALATHDAEKRAVDELAQGNGSRVAVIGRLEGEMRVEHERHAHERRLLEEEGITSDLRLEHDREQLERAIARLAMAHKRAEAMERESAAMNAKVGELLARREAASLAHARVVHDVQAEMLELRQEIERTFRKTLADAEAAHQAAAFGGALGGDAKDALLTNAKLKEELALQVRFMFCFRLASLCVFDV